MTFKLSTRIIAGISFVVLIALMVIVDRAEDILTHISYPMDTWRMDLDDALIGVGTFLLGVAAFVTLWRKADKTQAATDRVAGQINGGMSAIAREHVEGAISDADVEVGLWRRVDALEAGLDECCERELRCLEENDKLRDWVIARLDYSTEGRNTER